MMVSCFVHEDQHLSNCVAGLEEPLETEENGKAVLEIIFAAYESAETGRKVMLPFTRRRARGRLSCDCAERARGVP